MKDLNSCPGMEQISAYFDKECKSPEVIEEHLKQCPECQKMFDEIARIDYSLKHSVHSIGSDKEISEKILARVHSSIGSPRRQGTFFVLSPVQWRAASLLLIAGALGYFMWMDYRSRQDLNIQPERGSFTADGRMLPNQVKSSAKVPAVLSSYDSSSTLQLKELENVHFSAVPVPDQVRRDAAEISPKVRHVWSVPASAISEITGLIHKLGIKSSLVKESENRWDLKFEGTKLQAVQFVRACSTAGYQLFSPDQPQPETLKFYGSASDPVQYHCTFMVK